MDRLREMLEADQEKDMMGGRNARPDVQEVEVFAFSVTEALKSAAETMGTSIVNLEYEVLDRGVGGFLGIGKKPSRFLVKLSQSSGGLDLDMGEGEIQFDEPAFSANMDGHFKVTVTREGAFLEVEAPRGAGRRVTPDEIIANMQARQFIKFNESAIKKEAENPTGKAVRVADYTPSQYDAKFQLQITVDEMKAFATLTRPEKYGRVVDKEEVISALKSKNVFYGVKEKAVSEAVENELYNMPILVAEGDMPEEGQDAKLNYHFKIDKDTVNFAVEEDGSVDFHKLDVVQSVVVGQVLASKIPATRGKSGKTLSGRVIPARDGKDIKLMGGPNTHLSPDGNQIIADINGQVIFKNNKIQVEPVFEVSGDVDLTTGDINFPGNIIIYGNVNDTFKVYSGANVEIKGNVGKAEVVAEGNIVVRQGIQGKDEGKIVCAGDVYAKFIERANVKAEGYVVVAEAIMHSNIESKKKVLCQGGKRSQIAGGRIRALYEINAKFLGAEAFTETLVEVGTDPAAEDRIGEIVKRKEEISKELPDVTKQLSNLTMMMSSGELPPEKQELFNTLTLKNNELKQEMSSLEEQQLQLQQYMDGLGKDAKVSASKVVYPGVKVRIKNEVLIVKQDYKFVTYYKEGASIKISPYEKSKEMEEKLKGSGKARKI